MNWQTHHHQIIIDGVNSYVPKIRAELDKYFQQAPTEKSLEKLRAMGTKYIVFHKGLVLLPEEAILSPLKSSRNLTLTFEDAAIAIFEIKQTLL
jgi:hypothetical protein